MKLKIIHHILICSIVSLSQIIAEQDPIRPHYQTDETKTHSHYRKHKKEYDYIIVGDGTAGAILARKLSDGNKSSVLVLEWGENRTADPVVLSPNVFEFLEPLAYDPLYAINYSVPLHLAPFGKNLDIFIYTDGRMWGGSSAHNGLFAVRGTPLVYNQWSLLTNDPQWSYASLLPLMKAMENYSPTGTIANPAQRGFGGPLSITQALPVNNDRFAQGVSIGSGTSIISDYNDPSLGNVGISAHQQWITTGPNSERSFSALDFHPVGEIVDANGKGLNGRKLNIKSKSLVDRVIFKNKKAIGVDYISANNTQSTRSTAYAKKMIILSAGSNQTSAILQRSGIGPQALLDNLGIEVIVDNPHVGAHLFNHYGPNTTMTATTSAFPFLQGFIDGHNPVVPAAGMPADGVRRIQLTGFNASATTASLEALMIQPHSQGTVEIVSTDPTVYPRINLNFFSDGPVTQPGTDSYLAVAALKIIKNVALSLGADLIFPAPELFPAPYGPAVDDSLLLDYSKALTVNGAIAYHNVGTARMADSIENGVVDSNLRVFGVKHLMVADCSIEPVIEDGNTAYGAYVIGLNAAKILGVPVPPAL